jgi:hypothetical protein
MDNQRHRRSTNSERGIRAVKLWNPDVLRVIEQLSQGRTGFFHYMME